MSGAAPELRFADVVVVGSGVAGLSVALELTERTELAGIDVILLSKSGFGDGASRLAQGGIACAVAAGDSPAAHARDTLAVSAGLGHEAMIDILTAAAPARIAELLARGATFDRRADGSLELGREGGHGRHRILHAGGDATGAEVMRALCTAALGRSGLEIVEGARALDLATRDGRVAGLRAVAADGRAVEYLAPAVVLATGGFGAAYLKTTNPPQSTGDAIAIAARAGAALVDLEFVQFHPTALDVGAEPMPLLTEALRGAGAILVDARGRRFMPAIAPDAELAPRDVVARAIWEKLAGGERVYLDARPALAVRDFPTAITACGRHGLDPAAEPVPVSPAAHYTMGGVAVDHAGRTSLPGLWVCGEAAGSGLHGANRLASNSLLEGLVFGARVADDVAAVLEAGATRPTPVVSGGAAVDRVVEGDGSRTLEIRRLLWENVGLVRTRHGLHGACRALHRWAARTPASEGERNLLTLALLVTAAALTRDESRGAHFRRDHPRPRAEWRRRLFLGTDPTGLVPRPLDSELVARFREVS